MFLDPPYSEDADRYADLYSCDSLAVASQVREWAVANGGRPTMRIALCGYEGEHHMPADWEVYGWKARGGYASQSADANVNARRERIWFSPHCLGSRQGQLFG